MKNLTFRELTDGEVAEVSGGLLRNVLLRNASLRNLNSSGDNNVIVGSNIDHMVVNQSGHQSQQHVTNIVG